MITEQQLLNTFAEVKAKIPGLEQISFDVCNYGTVYICGFIHNGDCHRFDTWQEIESLIEKLKEGE